MNIINSKRIHVGVVRGAVILGLAGRKEGSKSIGHLMSWSGICRRTGRLRSGLFAPPKC